MPLDKLRWTTCSHVEADESGALNQWLAAAPNATPAHGQIGCNIWLTDMADRAPRALKNDEVLDLGGKKVRWLDTPHVPHNWDAGVIYEETTGTLFCSDLFTQMGPATTTTESDIVEPAIAVSDRLPYMPPTAMLEPTLRRLAALKPTTIALMHGPAFKGDGAQRCRRWRIITGSGWRIDPVLVRPRLRGRIQEGAGRQARCEPLSDHDLILREITCEAFPLPTLPRRTGEEKNQGSPFNPNDSR